MTADTTPAGDPRAVPQGAAVGSRPVIRPRPAAVTYTAGDIQSWLNGKMCQVIGTAGLEPMIQWHGKTAGSRDTESGVLYAMSGLRCPLRVAFTYGKGHAALTLLGDAAREWAAGHKPVRWARVTGGAQWNVVRYEDGDRLEAFMAALREACAPGTAAGDDKGTEKPGG